MPIKPIRFETFGPFSLRRDAGVITAATLTSLWEEAHEVALGIGVYIIAGKTGQNWTPWYVGKTDGGFNKRFLQHLQSKKHVFARLAVEVTDEELFVVFLARLTEGRKLKKARKPDAVTKTKAIPTIVRLEYDVLKKAHAKNEFLINKSNRVYLGKLSVPGFSGTPADDTTNSAKALRSLLST